MSQRIVGGLIPGLCVSLWYAGAVGANATTPKLCVGVYDSRAIAVAYAPSKYNPVSQKMQQLQQAQSCRRHRPRQATAGSCSSRRTRRCVSWPNSRSNHHWTWTQSNSTRTIEECFQAVRAYLRGTNSCLAVCQASRRFQLSILTRSVSEGRDRNPGSPSLTLRVKMENDIPRRSQVLNPDPIFLRAAQKSGAKWFILGPDHRPVSPQD